MLRVLDLYSGLHGWVSGFDPEKWDRTTLDYEARFGCDFTMNVFDVKSLADLERGRGRFDVVLASPPCERFSVAALSKNWNAADLCSVCNEWALFDAPSRTFARHEHEELDADHAPVCTLAKNPIVRPKNPDAATAMELVTHTLRLIEEYKPKFWIMENPRAMMRRLEAVQSYERRTVTYCGYGKHYMKPTDLWGGFPPSLKLVPACKSGMPCHEAAPRGSKTGVQGLPNSAERALVPELLSKQVAEAMEKDILR